MFRWCFLSVSWYFLALFDIYSREPDYWAENQIFKNFSKSLKTCLVGVFWEFHGILALFDIWAENRIFQPRIGFKKILKMPQSVLSWCFWVFQSIFSIVRHLGREPDFWAENRIFKKILKKPQNIFSWCFLSFKVFLALFDIWAENRMFEPRTGFSKISFKASKHV